MAARVSSFLLGLAAAVSGALAGCSVGGDVGQDGQYAFLPGSNVVDTTPYPLEHLLLLEEDADAGRSYVYLFSGQLGRAGIGLADIRRITAQSQGFQMAFDTPRARYADEEVPSRGAPVTLRMADDVLELSRLDDAGLPQSGARRWLASTGSGELDVRAYFGVLRRSLSLVELTIELAEDELTFVPELRPALPVATIDDNVLHLPLASGEDTRRQPLRADYLIVDMLQTITPTASADDDGGVPPAETEAIVRLTLPATAGYEAGAALVTDAAGKGCWSAKEPLAVRVDQVFRRYLERRGGDVAFVHHRFDSTRLAPELWSPLLMDPKPATYCEGFE